MKIQAVYPWITTRKKILITNLSDFFLVIFLNIIYLKNYEDVRNITYLIIWILVSYFLGRYHSLLESKINYRKYLFRSLLSFIILVFLVHLSTKFFNLIYPPEFLIFSFIFSFLFLITLSMFIRKFINEKNIWYFIGEKDAYEYLESASDFSQINYRVIYLEKNEIYSEEKLNNRFELIIDKLESLESFERAELERIGFKMVLLKNWYQTYLNRYPINLIEESQFKLIKNDNNIHLQNIIKRIGDIILSIIILLSISPIVLIICILIMLEDAHNPFYSQERTGLKGSRFKIVKLRTMKKNAENGGAVWSKSNDSRITNIGKILRRTRIDEIPQLISVIKGDMSLIGPRPERPEIDKVLYEKISNYDLRYLCKPGLSGWAQVNYPYGASIKDAEYKLSYDYYYQLNQNILLDLLILIKTIKLVINLEGAIAKK